jgi:Ca2+-binding RTX toxin-like protein
MANITGNAGNDILLGTDDVDTINGLGGNDTLSGGKGNDAYVVVREAANIVEAANGGIDTVRPSISVSAWPSAGMSRT